MQSKPKKIRITCIFVLFSFGCMISCTQIKEAPVEFRDMVALLESKGSDSLTVDEYREIQKVIGPYFNFWLNEVADFARYGKLNDTFKAAVLTKFILINKQEGLFKALKNAGVISDDMKMNIKKAFGSFKKHFPKQELPIIVPYISRYSDYTTFTARAEGKVVLGYSADMFLSDTFSPYKWYNVPSFYNRYNHPDNLPVQLVLAHMHFLFEKFYKESDMLELAIYNGKLWVCLEEIFPDKEPWELFGYKKEEWTLLLQQEGDIWKHYLNQEVLYNTNRLNFNRYFIPGDKTFGPGIPDDCPPKIGNFTGYRIVKQYLKKTGSSLDELISKRNSREILQKAAYNPIK